MIADRAPRVRGTIHLWTRDERTGLITPLAAKRNQIQYGWGVIAAQAIGKGSRKHRLAAMYVEYENVADPSDPVTIPTYDRSEDRTYYDELIDSSVRDYLRVPILQEPTIGVVPGFENVLTDELGNRMSFYAQTAGVIGINGKPFSAGANSKVFGAALVATPEPGDYTQDVVFARTYYDVSEQTVKQASSQVGITWIIDFEDELT